MIKIRPKKRMNGQQLIKFLLTFKLNTILTKIPSTQHQLQNTLFILKKENLPSIEHRDLSEDEKSKLELKLIDEELKLYTSVVELNSDELKEKWKEGVTKTFKLYLISVSISFEHETIKVKRSINLLHN